jgi:hypothetical protein
MSPCTQKDEPYDTAPGCRVASGGAGEGAFQFDDQSRQPVLSVAAGEGDRE